MRYIEKSEQVPACLQKFIDESWVEEESHPVNLHYNNFGSKAELTAILIAEQFGLCGYTGQYMTAKDWHNEHVIPQSICRDGVRDAGRVVGQELCCDLHYKNIIAAINIKGQKPYGATARKPKVLLPITPLQQNCGTKFLYTQAGEVIPTSEADADAKTTIEQLCLNEQALVDLRVGRLIPFVADDFLFSATEEELRQIISSCNTVDENDWLPEFAFVIQSVIESVLLP